MSDETCAVLAQVFPALLIAVALGGNAVHKNFLRLRGWEWSMAFMAAFSLVGLAIAVVGTQTGGLTYVWAGLVWFSFAVVIAVTGFFVLAALVTSLNTATAEAERPTRRELFRDFVRGRRTS